MDIRKLFFPQGETGSGTGCSEMLHSLCSWRFSRCMWTEPEETQSDLRCETAVSKRMDTRPFQPEIPCDHMIGYCHLVLGSGLL